MSADRNWNVVTSILAADRGRAVGRPGPGAATRPTSPCFVCGSERTDVRHSYHWARPVCLECIQRTAAIPVGFVCESRLPGGRLCLAAAPHRRRRRCADHAWDTAEAAAAPGPRRDLPAAA